MTDEEIRAFNKEAAERDHRNYKRDCQMLQDGLRCPNCGTIWECHCTPEQAHAAWQRIEARQRADHARRVRESNERIAKAQTAWEKRYGTPEKEQ